MTTVRPGEPTARYGAPPVFGSNATMHHSKTFAQSGEDMSSHSELMATLALMDSRSAIAFAAAILERMFPSYALFVQVEGFGDVALVRRAVDSAWRAAKGELLPVVELQDLQRRVGKLAPDMDDYGDVLGALALDFMTAVDCALDAMITKANAVQSIEAVVTKVADSIDMFVQLRDDLELEPAALEERIAADPLMQREIARQQQQMHYLQSSPPSDELLLRLRADAEALPAIEPEDVRAVMARVEA